MKRSPIRRCDTCKGQGVVMEKVKTTTIVKGKEKVIETTQSKPCPARCNNGVVDIRNI